MLQNLVWRVRRLSWAILTLSMCTPASAALVGVDRQTGTLFSIDIANASTTTIGAVPDTVGLAYDALANRLYGLTPFSLYEVRTGAQLGSLSPAGLTGIAFGSVPNKLYSATESNLVAIDTSSAAVTTVGTTGVNTGLVGNGAFASDTSHRLIMGTNLGVICGCASDALGDNLYILDELTGGASLLYSSVTGEGGFDAITVDASDYLYGVTQQDSLLRIDLRTGQAERLGVLGYASIRGLAFVPDDFFQSQGSVPEPSTAALLVVAIFLLGAASGGTTRTRRVDA